MLDIRLSGKAPIYEQLFNGIAQLISSGKLRPDEKLPAVREVAKQFGVNPNTVQKSYVLLEQAGLIYSVPAKGSYVSPQTDAVQALRAGALKRLESALTEANSVGITAAEAQALIGKIWCDEKGEQND